MNDVPDLLERTRMALAEAGYDESLASRDADGVVWVTLGPAGVPDAVCWRALFVAGGPDEMACWPCWSLGMGEDCDHPVSWPTSWEPGRFEDCGVDR